MHGTSLAPDIPADMQELRGLERLKMGAAYTSRTSLRQYRAYSTMDNGDSMLLMMDQ
jgi:hypothetical protein